ncbi:MAG: threonine transporter RhtB [Alphaproteobacteria bacterium PA3]|nr:MAG: threonine transporter RhtB [Alphaproteobacteria bacterium PA3]
MSTPNLTAYALMVLGVIVLPGMDMALVLGSTLAQGRVAGAKALGGVVTGGLVHMALGASGAAAVLLWWPPAFNTLLLAGAAYLAWIGWGLMRLPAGAVALTLTTPPAGQRLWWRGLLTCLLNPKASAFMLAVVPPFLQVPSAALPQRALALAAITAGAQVLVYGGLMLFVGQLLAWSTRARTAPATSPTAASVMATCLRWLPQTVGLVLVVVALTTAVAAWQAPTV